MVFDLKKLRPTLSYALVQAMLWGIYAVIMCFASNFLLANGLSNVAVSIVLGVSTAVSIAVQLVLGEAVSRNPKRKIWRISLFISALMLLGCGGMLLHSVQAVAVGGFALVCILLQTLPALVNAVGMDSIENGSPINFGLARGCGSLAYSLMTFIAGLVIRDRDLYRVELLGAAVIAVFAVSVVLFHFRGERERVTKTQEQPQRSQKGFLRQHKRFALFLAGSTLLLVDHNLICQFMLQIMEEKIGAGDVHDAQGTALAIGAIMELPAMFAFTWMLKKARCDSWVKVSCVFFVLKSIAFYLAPTQYGIFAAQLFQLMGFALYTISSVHYAEKVIGGRDAVRAQTYLSSTTVIGSLIALSTGGIICQYWGANTMLLIGSVAAILGAVIIFLSAEKVPKEEAVPEA